MDRHRAETPASWDPSITLRLEIDDIDVSRGMYPLRLDASNSDGAEMNTRHLGYSARQAEARLFAAALLLTSEQASFDEALHASGFAIRTAGSLYKDDTNAVQWEQRLKIGDLSLRIVPERGRSGGRRHDRALQLTYDGDRARRLVPIVDSCAAAAGSGADDPERAPHPATGAVADPFVADILAAVAVADARLALGNIRKPLADGQEVAFIE